MFKIVEYSLALGFPVLVFILALSAYPLDYGEVNTLVSSEGIESTRYIPTLVAISSSREWVVGYGVVEDVEAKPRKGIYILVVDVDGERIRVLLAKPETQGLDVGELKGSYITFYGLNVEYRGEKLVVGRVLVAGAPDTHDMHHVMCIFKGPFSAKCSEMMEKHVEMMKKMHSSRKRGD